MRRFGYLQARGSTSRGAQAGAAADAARHGRGTARGVHRGRSARAGLPRAAGGRLAGEGDRQPGRAVPHRVGRPAGRPGSWDRTQVPKPWSRVAIAIGEPLDVPGDADESAIEASRLELERRLQRAAGARAGDAAALMWPAARGLRLAAVSRLRVRGLRGFDAWRWIGSHSVTRRAAGRRPQAESRSCPCPSSGPTVRSITFLRPATRSGSSART